MTLGRMTTFDPSILKALLAEREMKAIELAARVGKARGVVSAWLSGRYQPSLATLPRIAAALDIEVLELAGKKNEDANFTELRYIYGYTGRDVADLAGLKQWQIQVLEDAVNMPNGDHLKAVASALKLPRSTVYEAWVRSRVQRFGADSLEFLDADTRKLLRGVLSKYTTGEKSAGKGSEK